jgi:hypothetical protein
MASEFVDHSRWIAPTEHLANPFTVTGKIPGSQLEVVPQLRRKPAPRVG